MILFECPSCKTQLRAADDHAGKTIECPTCHERAKVPEQNADAITAAAPTPPTSVTTPEAAKAESASKRRKREDRDDDDDDDRSPRQSSEDAGAGKAGMSIAVILAIVFGVGCCCIAGPGALSVALVFPAIQKVREAAARTESMNNLRRLSLGFHNYHEQHRQLPFNGDKKAIVNDPMSGSWGFQVLPFVEQNGVFATANRNAAMPIFLCVTRGRPPIEAGGGAWSDYFLNSCINDPVNPTRPNSMNFKRGLTSIKDGTSNTVLIGHGNISVTQYTQSANVTLCTNIFDGGTPGTMRAGPIQMAGQRGTFLQRDSQMLPTATSWGGPFPQGALIAMADGSVRTVAYSFPDFGALLTPSGGEAVGMPD